MTSQSLRIQWPVAVVLGAVLIGFGAGATYLLLRSPQRAASMAQTSAQVPRPPTPASSSIAPGPLADVIVPMSRDLIERAGITLVTVGTATTAGELRAPGIVEPNAYKVVKVTPTAGGRITRAAAELGDQVRRGQVLAQIYSSELADAQARYVAARAELDAHDREVIRTDKLVEIGAASRQELERIHAEHTERRAALQSAVSQLRLLGSSEPAPDVAKLPEPIIGVPSPLDGVITERTANVGLNVGKGEPLFTVVDLSTVWIVADVFEKDFSHVRIGTMATVTTTAYSGTEIDGTVSYIDPEVNPATRTAKVRIEVVNPGRKLRLGMLAEARFKTPGNEAVEVPRSAVQNVGDRSVVYLARTDPPTEFIEREVRLGSSSADRAQVLAGLSSGDKVVAEGSFSVRAERERLGLRPVQTAGLVATTASSSESMQTASIIVDDTGFHPPTVKLRGGVPTRVRFTRRSDKTCATEIVFPSLNIRRALPLNEPIVIEFAPAKADVAFSCGVNMFKGSIVINSDARSESGARTIREGSEQF